MNDTHINNILNLALPDIKNSASEKGRDPLQLTPSSIFITLHNLGSGSAFVLLGFELL